MVLEDDKMTDVDIQEENPAPPEKRFIGRLFNIDR